MPINWQTKKVQIVSAELQWDGSEESLAVIRDFVPAEFLEYGEIETFPAQPYMRVYNTLEHQWLNVPIGHWVVRGLKGEFYSCEPEAMDKKYFEVEQGDEMNLIDLIESLRFIGANLAGEEYVYTSEMIDYGNRLTELADHLEKHGVK